VGLLVSALVGWLCGHAHLCSRLSNHHICDPTSAHGTAPCLHLNLFSLHLTSRACLIAIDGLGAVSYLRVVEVRHCNPWLLLGLRMYDGIFSLTIVAISTSINLVNGLLNARHVYHRLLCLV
jgi:hypothetical protein